MTRNRIQRYRNGRAEGCSVSSQGVVSKTVTFYVTGLRARHPALGTWQDDAKKERQVIHVAICLTHMLQTPSLRYQGGTRFLGDA